MKKITILLSLMVVLGMNAQSKMECDTVTSVQNVKNVIITETGDGVKVIVKGTDEKRDYVYSYKHEAKEDGKVIVSQDWDLKLPFTKSSSNGEKRQKWAVVSGGLYMGFNSVVGESVDMGVKMGKSWELAWDRIIAVRYSPFNSGFSLSLGFGVGGKEFTINESLYRFCGDKNGVILGAYPEGVYPKDSKLNIFSLRVPFNLRQKLGDDFSVSTSVIMNLNTGAKVKSSYITENEVKIEESFDNAPVRKVSFDVMAALNYKCMGVYVKYSPQSIFKSGKGPDFKALTVGFGFSL